MNFSKKNMKNMMILIAFAALMLWVVFNYHVFINLVKFIFKLLLPLIIGIAISFVINVPMKQIENKIFKAEKRKHKKFFRALSLIISIVLIFGFVGLLMFLVVPEFIEAIINISKSITNSSSFINKLLMKLGNISPSIKNYINNINVNSIVSKYLKSSGNVFNFAISFVTNVVSRVVSFFVSFIISIYILLDKENLARQTKKILRAFFNENVVKSVVKMVKIANDTFSKFLTGQCLDACLIGFLFFIILSIVKVPYALILGVLFAFTALIPYVGAFITLVVGTTLIAVSSPIKAITYVITFFLIQQFDDNFTYPKIVGKSVGLPAIWALLAVIIGGSAFGIIGMLVSIPIASIIYGLFKDFINERVERKNKLQLTKK